MRTHLIFLKAVIILLTCSAFIHVPSEQDPSNQSMEMRSTSGVLFHSPDFEKAVRAYQEADFDKAIDLFSAIAQDESRDRVIRRDALLFLGRTYLAMRNDREARDALSRMADFEPPRVEIDPDVEPPHLLRLYYDVYKERKGSYEVPEASLKNTIAVVDFSNQSLDDRERLEPLQQGFSTLFINQLGGTTELKVVEREHLQWLLGELNLQRDVDRVDQQSAVRAGKLLGVHWVLMGTYMKFGKQMSMTARLVSVETGEIVMSDEVRGKADKFFELAEQLSLSIVKSINVEMETASNAHDRFEDTRSLDALLSYSEGLDLLEADQYRAAYEKFLEALEYDPSYKRASLKARSLEPLLAAAG